MFNSENCYGNQRGKNHKNLYQYLKWKSHPESKFSSVAEKNITVLIEKLAKISIEEKNKTVN